MLSLECNSGDFSSSLIFINLPYVPSVFIIKCIKPLYSDSMTITKLNFA